MLKDKEKSGQGAEVKQRKGGKDVQEQIEKQRKGAKETWKVRRKGREIKDRRRE